MVRSSDFEVRSCSGSLPTALCREDSVEELAVLRAGDVAVLAGHGLVHDDHIATRDDGDELANRALPCVGPLVRADRLRAVPNPPEVAIAERPFTMAFGIHLLARR